jgi:hypothetical protein
MGGTTGSVSSASLLSSAESSSLDSSVAKSAEGRSLNAFNGLSCWASKSEAGVNVIPSKSGAKVENARPSEAGSAVTERVAENESSVRDGGLATSLSARSNTVGSTRVTIRRCHRA